AMARAGFAPAPPVLPGWRHHGVSAGWPGYADPAVLPHQKTPPPPAAAAIHGANVAATTGGLPDHPYPVAPAGGRLRHRNRPAPAGSPDNHLTAVRLVAVRAAAVAASVAASVPQSHPAALRPELTDENQSSGAAAYQ